MEQFIDPRILARVRDLPLVARAIGDGFLHGIQPSHQRGVGIEFSQYRAYEPGDDPARIDWKLYARSDRYFVREAERESEIAVWFVLDSSQSMMQASEGGPWTKFDCAKTLVATLSYLAQRQGDLAGLLTLAGESSTVLPPATGDRQWHRILKQLHSARSGGRFPGTTDVQGHLARLQEAGLVVVVSDFHQAGDEILTFMRKISTSRNEVLGLQLLCADENDFPWHGATRFEDLETGESILLSASRAREAYLATLQETQQQLRTSLGQVGATLRTLDIDAPLDHALHSFLQQRLKRLHP